MTGRARSGAVALAASACALTGLLVPGSAAAHSTPSSVDRRAPADFRGAVEIFNCSGALVRWADSRPGDPAMMLTNGHCRNPSDKRARTSTTRRRFDREVVVNQPDSRPVTLLSRAGADAGVVRTKRVLYSTSFQTDVGLYTLRRSYADIRERFHVRALTLAATPPDATARIVMPSGFSREEYRCDLRGQVFRLFNDDFRWRQSLRLARSSSCHTIRGTSGSPLLDPASRVVVGINNAINVAARGTPRCTVSLCERSRSGRISVHPHRRYAQQTWWLTTCESDRRRISLAAPGCLLPKPPSA
jgi:hypothetical protein